MTRPELFAPLDKLKRPTMGDFYAGCQAGHGTHARISVPVTLDGQPHGIQDVPAIPSRLARVMVMEVYDWRQYFRIDGQGVPQQRFDHYCTGQDIVSYSIDMQGVWEGYESVLVLDILDQGKPNSVMLDFGSHLGWYSLLAATTGYQVASFDADPQNIDTVKRNAEINGVADNVHPYHSWIDQDAPKLRVHDDEVHLVKIDIEGAERWAVRMIEPLLAKGKINYLLIEVTPLFNDRYPALVEKIAQYGYEVYMVPNKGWEYTQAYGENPLAVLRQYRKLPEPGQGLRDVVERCAQENLLFVRRIVRLEG
jgi:hypothetical protein